MSSEMEELEDEHTTTWLTMHEVLDRSSISYRQLQELAEDGVIGTRQSGGAVLYCGEDVDDVGRSMESADSN